MKWLKGLWGWWRVKHGRLKERAQVAGVSVSEWVRQALLRELGVEREVDYGTKKLEVKAKESPRQVEGGKPVKQVITKSAPMMGAYAR